MKTHKDEVVSSVEETVQIPVGGVVLTGDLILPAEAQGIVLFVHGSGSSRHSPRNQYVAEVIRQAALGTLLFDLLTRDEEAQDLVSGQLRFDIVLLATRLTGATRWVQAQPRMRRLRVGYFGSSTGGAAALVGAAGARDAVQAVVSRGGRPDLAGEVLPRVTAPTLLIVGARDPLVLQWNREAYAQLRCPKELKVIPGATHLFEEAGALEEVAH